ncbi:unnamed protein product [Lactuca saligna]|uniref:Uncharacterized protein n=1 Tax=Lactuca saligna TaxID=75948 RepID=A0AA35YXD6_LACSI|nr:unnamed protein product [Lactuca saligna]
MSASSSRSINLMRVGNLRDDDPCPPCDCQDAASMEIEGPKCKFFMSKDKEMEEGYYKQKLHKMRFELKRKEEFSEVSKVQKNLVKLQKAMEEDNHCHVVEMDLKSAADQIGYYG